MLRNNAKNHNIIPAHIEVLQNYLEIMCFSGAWHANIEHKPTRRYQLFQYLLPVIHNCNVMYMNDMQFDLSAGNPQKSHIY